jgi:hypothetical protein
MTILDIWFIYLGLVIFNKLIIVFYNPKPISIEVEVLLYYLSSLIVVICCLVLKIDKINKLNDQNDDQNNDQNDFSDDDKDENENENDKDENEINENQINENQINDDKNLEAVIRLKIISILADSLDKPPIEAVKVIDFWRESDYDFEERSKYDSKFIEAIHKYLQD